MKNVSHQHAFPIISDRNEIDRNGDNDRLYQIDICILGSNYSVKKIRTPL